MEDRDEECELQQLVASDVENDDDDVPETEKAPSLIQDVPKSNITAVNEPKKVNVTMTKDSCSDRSNKTNNKKSNIYNASTNQTKVSYVNERRPLKDYRAGISRPRKDQKDENETRHHSFLSEVPDVRNMEKSLIGLLDDFHSGKLRAFGKGCSMEQMTNIREQQERLARLHFELGTASISTEQPLGTDSLQHSKSTMAQLVEKLEQLSVSIEKLHSSSC